MEFTEFEMLKVKGQGQGVEVMFQTSLTYQYQTWARMHHKVVGNFISEADV